MLNTEKALSRNISAFFDSGSRLEGRDDDFFARQLRGDNQQLIMLFSCWSLRLQVGATAP